MIQVAILLATYNGEKYIEEQLDSIRNQSFKDFKCYIHDDGSKDRTVEICKKVCLKDDRFIILDYPSTGGAKYNFLSLMKKVDADYYFFSDQDDYWLPDKIMKMVNGAKEAKKKSDALLVFSDLKVVNEKLEVLSESFYKLTHVQTNRINFKNALVKGYIPGCAMMINKVMLNKANQYQNLDTIKMHDWWIVILAYLIEADIIFVNQALVYYRQHSDNTIGAKKLTTMDRIKENTRRLFSGELRSVKKINLQTPRDQAKELYLTGLGEQNKRDFLKEYSCIGDKCKLLRVLFYICNFKNVYRMWWMLFWV